MTESNCYAVALGSNQRHQFHGRPNQVLSAAAQALSVMPLTLVAQAAIVQSRPIGPSHRTYANTVVLIETTLSPPKLLLHLKTIERAFGRRQRGGRWRARVLDLDIILWSAGIYVSAELSIPHPAFRNRAFVLNPLVTICPGWRDPVSGLRVSHLKVRLDRKRIRP
jgi:2-amino-4-hydroxy-6-hydroxymethyldihydropteridine diphosphokinase